MPASYIDPLQNIPTGGEGPAHPFSVPAHSRVTGYENIRLDESTPISTPPPNDPDGAGLSGHLTNNTSSLHPNSAALNVERKISLLPPRKPSNLSSSLIATSPISAPSPSMQGVNTGPSAVASSTPTISHHAVYAAVYSGVPVYEMMCRNVAIMRRRADSFLNATQILKVAGIDKGRRTKILEREILIGEHEKVQGGYGKYQGTWYVCCWGKDQKIAGNFDESSDVDGTT